MTVRRAGRGETRRLVFMAVVTVLLGAVVAANLAEDRGATEDPRASFTFDGSAGMACTQNVTRVTRGTTCRVPNATHERLYVVREGTDNGTLILARRAPDPTPTPTPTPVPAATATPTTVTGTGTPATGTGTPDGTATVTAGPNGTVPPAAGTPAPTGTPTGETAS